MNIIQTITQSVTEFFKGMGSSIVDLFENLFISSAEGGGLTTFAIVSLTFLGLSLALGLFYAVFRMIRR